MSMIEPSISSSPIFGMHKMQNLREYKGPVDHLKPMSMLKKSQNYVTVQSETNT